MFRSAQHDNYLNPIHGGAASNVQNQIMNEQQTLDKAGTPRRLKIMNNEAQSIYGLLVNSEEKGRSRMETAVYATCILSVVVAIDRKSTRLNSSHSQISYAVFCL